MWRGGGAHDAGEGLRVLDCSIMPTIVSAKSNAAEMVIAHKGIEMVTS
jgi:choline dehydrogenase-like flavoprotein